MPPMKTEAKSTFVCESVTQYIDRQSVVLFPLFKDDCYATGHSWFPVCENLKLTLNVKNPEVFDVFEPGAEYCFTVERIEISHKENDVKGIV